MPKNAEELKKVRVETLLALPKHKFVRFKGAALISAPGTNGYQRLQSSQFAEIVYKTFGLGASRSNIAEFQHAVETMSPDWSDKSHLIGFHDQVWDMKKLELVNESQFVYSANIELQPTGSKGYEAAKTFLLELAMGDEDLARDYQQAMAPLLMFRRPAGIIWFLGSGANGKSALLNALYLIFEKHFAGLTLAQIEDGKALPALTGILGNIVREGSEQRVEDSAPYKAIGTHEPIEVRKLYSQEMIIVPSTFHTIFNANNIPNFTDKTVGARRRTLLIPFPAKFKDDPTFEEKTFTPEFLGGLVTLLMEGAKMLAENGYKYSWSHATKELKKSYDSEVNSAEAFLQYLNDSHICGFFNYTRLKINYESWCSDNGLIALYTNNLKRTMANEAGAVRRSFRGADGKVYNRYFLSTAPAGDNLVWLDSEGYGLATPTEPVVAEQLELKKDKVSEW